jgi:heme exporter protein B
MAAVLPSSASVRAGDAPGLGPAAREPLLVCDGGPTPGLLAGAWALAARDLRIAWRRRTDTLAALVFFLMVSSLFPLAVGPEPQTLRLMAGGVTWVAALLAGMLSLARLFNDDLADGTLEQLLLSPHPLALLVAGKVLAHWIGSGLLVTLAAPLIALQYGLPADAAAVLVLSLLLGTPILSLVGAVTAALTVGLRGGAMLLALLVLPLCVPVLVFGAGAVQAMEAGLGVAAHLSLLGAGLLLSLAAAPLACAQALRISLEA